MVATNFEEGLPHLALRSLNSLPSSYIKLRSYLSIYNSKKSSAEGVRIFYDKKKTCPYCYSPWRPETCSFKLLPSKKIRNTERNEKKGEKEASEVKINTLLLTCKVCTKKTYVRILKKKTVQKEILALVEDEKRKKKKKKKDKTCGLFMTYEEALGLPQKESKSPTKKWLPVQGGAKIKKNKTAGKKPPNNSMKPRHHHRYFAQHNVPHDAPCDTSTSTSTTPLSSTPSQNVHINPYSGQTLPNEYWTIQRNLKKLKKAIKQGTNVAKKSFQDFLNLI